MESTRFINVIVKTVNRDQWDFTRKPPLEIILFSRNLSKNSQNGLEFYMTVTDRSQAAPTMVTNITQGFRLAWNRWSEKHEIRLAIFRNKSCDREKYFGGGPGQHLKQTKLCQFVPLKNGDVLKTQYVNIHSM